MIDIQTHNKYFVQRKTLKRIKSMVDVKEGDIVLYKNQEYKTIIPEGFNYIGLKIEHLHIDVFVNRDRILKVCKKDD